MIEFPTIADGEDKTSPFANCLRNNFRHVRKMAKRTSTECFRLYDRDIKEYPIAVDYYKGRFCIQYFSPTRSQLEPSNELVQDTQNAIQTVFGSLLDGLFWKTRAKRKETRQYEKMDASKDFFTCLEYGVKFKINLTDYLDTGLFLDHRETRQLVASQCKNKSLLNLFAYTSSFSVHAASQGASFTKSVDMSNTYCAWSQDNFILNELPLKNNVIVREDCLKFLDQEVRCGVKYDVVVIDPPTISRSKKMDQLFDIQNDYVYLIQQALKLLEKDGVIFFSTNFRKFVLDKTLFANTSTIEITNKTRAIDFRGIQHRVWSIKKE